MRTGIDLNQLMRDQVRQEKMDGRSHFLAAEQGGSQRRIRDEGHGGVAFPELMSADVFLRLRDRTVGHI